MLWARVVRGINSTANEVTPVWAISCKISNRTQWPQKAHQHLPATHQRHIGFSR